jgi:glutamate synthase domain-containing protein 2
MCNTNNCPAGIATQKPELRALLDIGAGAKRLASFFGASVQLMQVLARACGHQDLNAFTSSDLTTWKKNMADLSGVSFGGPGDG